MSKKAGLFCLALALLIPPSGGIAQQPVHWETTLDNAQRLAGQSNKLVLVYFWAQWCPVCKRMEAEVLDQSSVAAELSANYVLVKINADHFPTTAKQYGVTHLPTTVVITPQGQPLDSMRGRLEAAPYVARLNLVATTVKQRGAGVLAQIPAAKTPPVASQPAPVQTQSAGQTPSIPAYGQSSPQVASAPVYGNQLPPAASPPVYGNPSPPPVTAPSNPIPSQPQVASAPTNVNQWPPPVTAPTNATPSPPPVVAPLNPAPSPPLVASAAPFYGYQLPPQATQPTIQPPPIQPTTQPTVPPSNQNNPALQGQVTPLPKGDPNFGLDGFCPVSLCERQQWVPGDRRWGLSHRGRTYLFAGPEEMKRFNADPDRYAPVISGNDVVMAAEQGQFVRGLREHGVFFGRRVYLFSSEESLEKFAKNPKNYANQALEALRSGAFPDRQLR